MNRRRFLFLATATTLASLAPLSVQAAQRLVVSKCEPLPGKPCWFVYEPLELSDGLAIPPAREHLFTTVDEKYAQQLEVRGYDTVRGVRMGWRLTFVQEGE